MSRSRGLWQGLGEVRPARRGAPGGFRGPLPPLHQLGDPPRGAPGGFRGCGIDSVTAPEVTRPGQVADRDAPGPPRGCWGGSRTSLGAPEDTWDPLGPLHGHRHHHLAPERGVSRDRIRHIGDRRRRPACMSGGVRAPRGVYGSRIRGVMRSRRPGKTSWGAPVARRVSCSPPWRPGSPPYGDQNAGST